MTSRRRARSAERERSPFEDVQLGQFLGSIVLGFAQLGLGRYAAALRAFEEVSARSAGQPVLLDWILHMPLRLGLGEYWLAVREFGRAREHLKELCRLATTAGERTYLALARRALAEAALAERDVPGAERELAEAFRALDGCEAPLAEWRVCGDGRAGRTGARPRGQLRTPTGREVPPCSISLLRR